MNAPRIILVFFLFPFLYFSCGSPTSFDPKGELPEILLEASLLQSFDEVASEVSFIELKQPKNDYINLSCGQHLIHFQGDTLWFADRCYPNMSVHLFLKDGSHLTSWNKRGESPGEYRSLHGMQINNERLKINAGTGKVVEYTIPGFEYSNTLNLGNFTFLSDFRQTADGRYIIAPELEMAVDANKSFPVFYLLDTSSMEKEPLPIRATMLSTEINEGKIALFDEGYLLNYGIADTIYQYLNGHLTPYLRLNFGKKSVDNNDLFGDEEFFFAKVFTHQTVAFNAGEIAFSEKDRLLRIKTFGLRENPELEMNNRKTFPFEDIFINSDFVVKGFPALVEFGNNVGIDNNGYFYEVIQYEDGQNLVEKGLLGKYTSEYQKLLNDKKEPEDPVILRYKVNF
ncbi:6-bladed beta-propeller [Pleomorphovibrio marinus]|uniref:6-bladed beta-propeller n=1 Tax=Pleomorphovibrio marinus TaxID=2164132 RepID=UPI000E0CBC10|nr:6-bladed beta-propeller [Pleomorphovibrio marinus]